MEVAFCVAARLLNPGANSFTFSIHVSITYGWGEAILTPECYWKEDGTQHKDVLGEVPGCVNAFRAPYTQIDWL